ncbi:MAG: hypothetical protein R3E83_14175 [Burkholderiaceae bacterium]
MNSPNPRLQYVQVRAPGPFTKALAVIAGAGLLVVGLMFSIVFVGVALVVGAIVGGWFWWKTRALRRDLRAQMARMQSEFDAAVGAPQSRPGATPGAQGTRGAGTVIDGDFIREREPTTRD